MRHNDDSVELSPAEIGDLEAFARGWNSACKLAGNPSAQFRAPAPGDFHEYNEGRNAALQTVGVELATETINTSATRGSGV